MVSRGIGMASNTFQIVSKDSWIPDRIDRAFRDWSPRTDLGRFIRSVVAHHLPAEVMYELIDRFSRIVIVQSQLQLVAIYGPNAQRPFTLENFGVVSQRLVTDTGVGFIVDAFQNIVELENMKFHGLGTGSVAEAAGDTALGTELTTEYTGNVRATGTTAESAANAFQTVATNTLDGTPGAALREHGVFSASSAGVLLDRSVYAAITLVSGDGLQSTYTLTFTSGG